MKGERGIRDAFAAAKDDGRGALVTYLMGGDPGPGKALPYLRALAEGGADLIEIGIPFSDPVADGPTIQKAAVRARAAGTRVADVFDEIAALRDAGVDTPVVAMTYANIPYTIGYATYAKHCKEVGIDGTIIPDMPVDEAAPLSAAMAKEGLATVLLAAPLSRGARLTRIAKATRGFLYLVGSFGTTGARGALADETLEVLSGALPAARAANVPLAVGFGVSEPEQVRALVAGGADGVVVGSALVHLVEQGAAPARITASVRHLCEGLVAPKA